MQKTILTPNLLLTITLSFLLISKAPLAQKYFVDASSQVDEHVGLDDIISRMNDNNVKRTLLSARSNRSFKKKKGLRRKDVKSLDDLIWKKHIIKWNKKYPEKIMPMVRTKFGVASLRKQGVELQINSGKFIGIGELLVFHAAKTEKYGKKPKESAYHFTDDWIEFVISKAIDKKWPVNLHIEFEHLVAGRVSDEKKDGYTKDILLAELSQLLNKHMDHPFILNHLGQLNSAEVLALIEKHPNIYFTTAHTTKPFSSGWTLIFDEIGSNFLVDWKTLFIKHPNRFVFALDNVWGNMWQASWYAKQMENWTSAMSELPPDVANLIAHGNAERLYKLEPK